MSTDQAHAEALRRIRHARDTAAEVLDLGDLPMAELPDELGTLTNLKVLALGKQLPVVTAEGIEWELDFSRESQQFHSLEPLKGLVTLTTLNLFECGQLTTVEPLRGLTALTFLSLFRCKRLADLEPLRGLAALTTLSLVECNQLTSVEPLRGLTALTFLDLSMCDQLTSVEPLRGLTTLTTLNLVRSGQLTTVEPLRGLTALTFLGLSGCDQLTTVEPLRGLTALTELDLSGCDQLTSVEPLRGLTTLTTLNLGRSGFPPKSQPCGLPTVIILRWSGYMQLTDLEPLRGLTCLTKLNLRGCRNISVRDLEPLFPSLDELVLSDASCTDFPNELCGSKYDENVLPAVRAYFADLGEDPTPDAEVKVYVLGNGRVGKTKLVRRLRDLEYGDPHEISTHGVRVYDHEIRIDGVPHPVRLNLWDFGGQDIYHASHSLFLRGPSVFLLLWCPEHENEKTFTENGIPLRNRRLPYWFDYLREHAGNRGEGVRSPVLLIQSQCDDVKQERKPDCDLPGRDEFPKLQVLHASAKTEHNLADVKADLGKAVRYLFQHFPRPKLGPGWVAVRDAIRTMQANGVKTLSRAEFDGLCTEGVSNTGVLLTFLHQSGVVFFDPKLFDGRIILDQQWALDAIYTVCDRQRTMPHFLGDGKFTRDHLKLLAWEKFSDDEQRLFLGMMESCGICFRTKQLNPGRSGAEYEYIAPDWLPGFEARATLHSKAKTPTDAGATASFHFLHEGVVRGLLAKVGRKFGDQAIYWKYGFWFPSEASDLLAQVTWDDPAGTSLAGKVTLSAWGPNAEKIVSAVLETLAEVTTGTPPVVTRAGKPTAQVPEADEPHIRAGRGVEALPVGRTAAAKPDRRVFISYAWGDTSDEGRKREKLVLELVRAIESWGYEPLYDKERLRPGDVVSQYMTLAGQTAKVLAILSAKYLRSEYCIPEIFAVYRKCDDADQFRTRVVGLALDDSKHLTMTDRAGHAKFWRERYQELKAIDPQDMADDDLKTWKQMIVWATEVPNVLKAIADTIHPVGLEAIAADGFAAVKAMLDRPNATG